jgi:hypothetical protein
MVRGPDSLQGTIFRPVSDRRVQFSCDQVWKKEPRGRFYVGLWNDEKPGPHDLLRSDARSGNKRVKLLDGNEWEIPVVRDLPRVFEFSEGETWVFGEVVSRYRELSTIAKTVAPLLYPAGSTPEEIREAETIATQFFVAALQANYRIGPMEISMLGLVDIDAFRDILRAALDWDGYLAIIKNEESRSASSEPSGDSGSSQSSPEEIIDTIPHLAS